MASHHPCVHGERAGGICFAHWRVNPTNSGLWSLRSCRATNQRLARQRSELRHLKNAQGTLRAENRELHRHALALEGELASALLALDAEEYEETRALLVRARGELAGAVSNGAAERVEPAETEPGRSQEPDLY